MGFQLAQAITITTRYSVVRQQGHGTLQPKEGIEKSIIDYKSQHHRLFTLTSKAFGILFSAEAAIPAHTDMHSLQAEGDYSTLAYVHTLICGLKAWSTQTAADGCEDARKMVGGHGYLDISGLPAIASSCVATTTFEGENWVLWQQLSSYIVKQVGGGSLPVDLEYVQSYMNGAKQVPCPSYGAELLSFDTLLGIFRHRAARLIVEAV